MRPIMDDNFQTNLMLGIDPVDEKAEQFYNEIQCTREGSAGFDLICAEDVTLKAGEFKLLSLGVRIAIPEGYFALVMPRSSTFKNYGILQANSLGLIDQNYSGPNDIWRFPAYATRDIFIKAGSRICQFVLVGENTFNVNRYKSENHRDRGGFGSTGK